MGDHMPWMTRQAQLQGRVDHILMRVLHDRGTACNHGQMVIPDYLVPGYTGCLNRNPTNTSYLFKRCCPIPDWYAIENSKPNSSQHASEPSRQLTLIVPGLRL
ncbi:hypothetical protein JTE90_008373 [Oedothorax gibbosus]|uniref:Uncharacterized protein n=1 Tax=Oedothorax gibbosus TaxID=931172 RepID=A0AAV6V5Q0_9ARAC|nr:hypothetical protein JTE90_008373 [Oedothorax gibbosus]